MKGRNYERECQGRLAWKGRVREGSCAPGRLTQKRGSQFLILQGVAELSSQLAGCGGGAPSMLGRQGEKTFSPNIEGALPEEPAHTLGLKMTT